MPAAELQEWIDVLRLDLGAKLLIAILAGGAIGLERELRHKPAGLRTNILICLGSALLMDLSTRIAGPSGGDPGRIAAQVVTGIGFLGAGTILHTRGTITGLTSAATIWVVAAIGLTAGAGFVFEALAATITVMVVLEGMGYVERRFLDRPVDTAEGIPPDEFDARTGGRRGGDASQRRRASDRPHQGDDA